MADLSLVPDDVWAAARRRAEVLRTLAEQPRCPRRLARAAAGDLGLSERRVYALVRRLREANGELTALLPEARSGGRGRSRLPCQAEALMSAIIDEVYLTPHERGAAALVREVTGRCAKAGLRPPAPATIRRRLKALPLADRAPRRGAPAGAGVARPDPARRGTPRLRLGRPHDR